MPDIKKQEKIARKLLPIIYVLDTSGSMTGAPIAAVNQAMNETMDVLKDVSNNNPTAELKIGVMQFDSEVKWITDNGFVFMEDFYWNDLNANGLTELGAALNELDSKLSRSAYLDSDVGYKVPVIIFMSDGAPTDDYESALNKVKSNNKWFKAATKIAIAVGDGADLDILTKVVDNNPEAVIKVDDLEALKKLIRVVSVTASMVGSKSRTDSNSQSEIVSAVSQEMGNDIVVADVVNDDGSSSSSDDSNDDWDDSDWD